MNGRALILTLALSFAGAAVSFAQSPEMGTWKLNEAKSHIPAEAQKNTTVTYETFGDNVKVTTDGTMGGQPLHTEWTGKFDGKPYPCTGDSEIDSRTYTKVNDHTLALTNTMHGKATTRARITVSPDGKTRTLRASSTDHNGNKISEVAVYEKQ